MHRAVGALIAVLTAVLTVLGGAGTASAHGALVSTDPAQNSVVPKQPPAVTLTFGEGVTLPSEALRVFDPAGKRADAGTPEHADGRADTVQVALRGGLADGTYTVAWQVISADSHPVGGAFTFSIGAPSASSVSVEELQGPRTDGLISFLYGTGRAVAYAAFALLAGAAAFVLICWPAGASVRRVQRLLVAGWVGLLGSTVVLMMLRGPYEQGSGIAPSADPAPAHAHVPVDERIYVALAARLLLLAASGVFLVLLVGQLGQSGTDAAGRPRSRSRLGAAGLTLAVGLSATWVVTDHASEGAQVWLALPVTALHLLAMAAWLGGLVTLVAGLRQGLAPAAVERFSLVAFVSVTVLVLTGLYRSWREVGSWDALFGTEYGRLLLIKAGCVTLMVGVAWISRSRLARLRTDAEAREGGSARAGLRRSVLTESAVAVVVLVVTTMLTSTPPGRTARADASDPRSPAASAASAAPGRTVTLKIPFDTGGRTANAKGTATMRLVPAKSGGYTVRLQLAGTGGEPADVPEVRLAFTLPARDLGPLQVTLRPDGAGRWSGAARLALAGDWTVWMTVRSSDVDEATSSQRLPIGGGTPR